MEINNWTRTSSWEELALARFQDMFAYANTDPKHRSKIQLAPRPFEMLDENQSRITVKAIPVERADILYKNTVQTKTDDEIREINRQKILAKKKQKEALNEQQ